MIGRKKRESLYQSESEMKNKKEQERKWKKGQKEEILRVVQVL